MRLILRTIVLLFLVAGSVEGQGLNDTLRLKEYIGRFGQAEVSIEYPGRDEASEIGRLVSIDRYHEGRLHIILSKATLESFLGLGKPFRLEEPSEGKGIITASELAKALDWDSYPTYTQYDSIMRRFASDYPSLCRLDTIGTSINGKLVLVLKISDNVHLNEEDEPEVFYTSTMHGDELGGFILMLRLADYLLSMYGTDERVRFLVDNLQIYINPLANPDGTYRTGNTITNPVRANANGRDLNRNFPDPLDPDIIQEKETLDMIVFMRQHNFVLSANFHSGAEVVNYPWDRWLTRFHADDTWFEGLSRAYADTAHQWAPSGYMTGFNDGIVRGSVWYVIYGGRQDFVTYELQGREVTIELDDIKQTPSDQLETLWQSNYRSLLNYLGYSLYGIRGYITNSVDHEPVGGAMILVPGHDKDSSQVYSSLTSGYYNRLLAQGTWTIKVTAQGYRDTVITGIVLNPMQPTLLNIALEPVANGYDTLVTDNLRIMPNPSRGDFRLLLPDTFEGIVLFEIISSSGKYIHSEEVSYSYGLPVTLSTGTLSPGVYFIRARSRTTSLVLSSRAIIIR